MQPVCFLADDPRKKGLRMHGLPVVGGHAGLDWAVERYGVTKILLGTRKLSPETLAAVRALAARRGTELIQLDLDFHAVTAQQQPTPTRSEEHTSELQSQSNLVCRLLLEKKKQKIQH